MLRSSTETVPIVGGWGFPTTQGFLSRRISATRCLTFQRPLGIPFGSLWNTSETLFGKASIDLRGLERNGRHWRTYLLALTFPRIQDTTWAEGLVRPTFALFGALLARTIVMLERSYQSARVRKNLEWRRLDQFFWELDLDNIGFISMNWDVVIERKLSVVCEGVMIDYGCDALPA
jgi:hypothetical protein